MSESAHSSALADDPIRRQVIAGVAIAFVGLAACLGRAPRVGASPVDGQSQSSHDAARSPSLFQPLPATAVFNGCGCSFTLAVDAAAPAASVVFSSDYEGVARVSLGGRIIELSARCPDLECRPSQVGDRCTLKYQSDEAKVVVKLEATWVCPDGDPSESCEVTRLQGQMSGRAGDRQETVEVRGECGC